MEKHVCKKFCSFRRPEKEATRCGTFGFLQRNLSSGELRKVSTLASSSIDLSRDRDIRSLICDRCDLRTEGCDYIRGMQARPCGGYAIVEHLLKDTTLLLGPRD